MKLTIYKIKNLIIILVLTIILFFGCSKDNFETGIKGTIEYGQGDCMPIGDYEGREYDKYKGDIYFINKEDLDNLGNGDFDQLKNNSIIVSVKRGKLSTELSIGNYLVMSENVYLYSEENTITISLGEVLYKDFKFWKCTSY